MLLCAVAASAAVDPDVDPAHQLAISHWIENLDLEIVDAGAYLHETATGLAYLRLDFVLRNSGSEPQHAFDWQVQVDGVELTISPDELLDPGETKQLAQLVLGTQIQGLHPGSAVFVGVVGRPAASQLLCANVPTRAQCEIQRAAMDGLCWQRCVGQGGHGGGAECVSRTHEDRNGVKCTFWTPLCVCRGRPSLTESLDAGLIDLTDPRAGGPVIYPPLLETRPFDVP